MESAKVYQLNRNQLERSPLMTAPTAASRPKLLDQVRQAIRTRHYSPKTEESYVHDVLRKEIGYVDGVIRAKRPHRLPVVLTRQEVMFILGILDHSDWLMVMLLYGSGLRLMECLQLRVKDIDFITNQIVVRAGKGNKDRQDASGSREGTTR
jgi:integrase